MTLGTVTELELDRSWTYGVDTQHGGRLLERVTDVALAELPHPHPLAVTAHFLSTPRLGTASVPVSVLRTGRSVSTASARLEQEGRTCVDVTVTAGTLREHHTPRVLVGAPPELPPVEECVANRPPNGEPRNGITEQLDLRLDPSAAGWLSQPSGVAEVKGWVRYTSGRQPDPLALVCLSDALPPVTFALGLKGWAPTIELTVHVRALPAPGWLRLVQRAQLVGDGWLDETCEIWDSADTLVAQAVQLAGYREPAGS